MSKLLSLFGGFGLTQYLIAALVVALLGVAGLGWVVKRQIGTIAVQKQGLKALADALDRARLAERQSAKAIVARDKKIAQIAAKSAAEKRALEAALLSNRPWADQPVPKEVQDALNQGIPPVGPADDHRHCLFGLCRNPDSGPGEGESTSGVAPGLPDHLGEYRDQRPDGSTDPVATSGPPGVQRGQESPPGLERFGLDQG